MGFHAAILVAPLLSMNMNSGIIVRMKTARVKSPTCPTSLGSGYIIADVHFHQTEFNA
jgi:hypothetical protein